MAGSQKFIARNRAPRVQIEYDVEVYGAEKKVQLPFVMGVMSDLSGKSEVGQPSVADRKFLEIDIDNFDERMRAIKPRVQFAVPNTMTGEGNLSVDIAFERMDDFSPAAIARKVEPLRKLLEAREQLNNLMTYMDGKTGAEELLDNLVGNPEQLRALLAGGAAEAAAQDAVLDAVAATAPDEDEATDHSGDILASLAANAPDDAPAEDANANVLADMAASAPEAVEDDDTSADVLASMASMAPEEAAEVDHSAELLAGMAANAPDDDIEDDGADDLLAVMAESAPDETPEDDGSDALLAGMAADAPDDDIEDDGADDLLAGMAADLVDDEPKKDASGDLLAGMAADIVEDEVADDGSDALLAGMVADAPDDAVEDDGADALLAGMAESAPDETPEDDGSDALLAGIAADAPDDDIKDDGADDLLAGMAADLVYDEPEEDGADDLLADMAADLVEDEVADDGSDALLAGMAADAPDDAPEDGGSDDLLAGMAADLVDDEPEEDGADDLLADMAADLVEDEVEDDGSDELLADMAADAPEDDADDDNDDLLSEMASALDEDEDSDDETDSLLAQLADDQLDDDIEDDSTDDLLADMADSADEDVDEDDSDSLLADMAADGVHEDEADDSTDDLLAEMADFGADDEDEDDSDSLLAEMALDLPNADDEEDDSDDLLAAMADDAAEDENSTLADLLAEDEDDGLAALLATDEGAESDSDGSLEGENDLPDLDALLAEDDDFDLDALLGDDDTDLESLLSDDADSDLDDLLGDDDSADEADDLDALLADDDDAADDLDLERLLGDDGEDDTDLDAELGEDDSDAFDLDSLLADDADGDLDDLLGDDDSEDDADDLDALLADGDDDTDLDDLLGDDDSDLDALLGGDDVDAVEEKKVSKPKDGFKPNFGEMSAPALTHEAGSRRKFRIAVLGDFSGRANRGELQTGDELATRKAFKLDFDTLETVISRFRTTLTLPVGSDGSAMEIELNELDDLHPDELFDNMDVFSELSAIRRSLTSGKNLESALRQLEGWGVEFGDYKLKSSKRGKGGAAPADMKLSDFQSLIGDTTPRAEASDAGDIIARIIGPYITASPQKGTEAMIAAVDNALSGLMSAILHHPDFQTLESAWRAIDLLGRRVESGTNLEVVVYDMAAEEFAADLAGVEDMAETGLFDMLVERPRADESQGPLSAVVGLYTWEETPPHAEILARMARISAYMDAPFISAISTGFMGIKPEDRHPLVQKTWGALREMPEARYLGLATPRFMLRMPYGKKSDPIDRFEYEEFNTKDGVRTFLMANPALLVAVLLAETVSQQGKNISLGSIMTLDDIPFYYMKDQYGDQVALPCTERLLNVRTSAEVVARGYMPVLSIQGQNVVRLGSFQAVGGGELAGIWSGDSAGELGAGRIQARTSVGIGSATPKKAAAGGGKAAATAAAGGGGDGDDDDLDLDFGGDDDSDDLDLDLDFGGDDDGGDLDDLLAGFGDDDDDDSDGDMDDDLAALLGDL